MFRLYSWYQLIALPIAAIFILAGSIGAASAQPARTHAGASSALILDVNTGQDTLDPAVTVQFGPASTIDALYARLTTLGLRPGPKGTLRTDPTVIKPSLATSWTLTHNNTVYTFFLRHNAHLADGRLITAATMKYVFDRNLKMGTGGNYFTEDGITGNVKSTAVAGTFTFVVTLKHPDPNILQSWATPDMGAIDPTIVQAHGGVQAGKVNTWVAAHGAGFSGAYVLGSYQPDNQIVFKANPTYYGPQPGASQIVENVIHSDSTLLLRARSGAADVTMGLSYQAVNSLRNDKNVRIIADPTTKMEELEFNNKVAPLNNVTFRKALAYAVPYQQIIKKVAYGYGVPFGGPLPPAMPFYDKSLTNPYHYDLTRAKALLQQSKVPLPVTLTDTIEEGNATQEQISTIVQAIWSTLGVHLTINRLAPSDYTSSLFAHKTQVFMREDGPGVIDPGYFLGYDMTGCAATNFSLSNICIPQAEKLNAQARFTTSAAKRQQLFNQISRLWIADAPKINLYEMKAVTVISKRVKRFVYADYGFYQDWSLR
jgi:peptide/nickel transport system substrate-binding protein